MKGPQISKDLKKPTLWQVLISVLGAFLGVQSSRVRERDFMRGHPWWIYGMVALFMMTVIIIFLILVAKIILMSAKML